MKNIELIEENYDIVKNLDMTLEQIEFITKHYKDSKNVLGVIYPSPKITGEKHNKITKEKLFSKGFPNTFRIDANLKELYTNEIDKNIIWAEDSIFSILSIPHVKPTEEFPKAILVKVPRKIIEENPDKIIKEENGISYIASEYILSTFEGDNININPNFKSNKKSKVDKLTRKKIKDNLEVFYNAYLLTHKDKISGIPFKLKIINKFDQEKPQKLLNEKEIIRFKREEIYRILDDIREKNTPEGKKELLKEIHAEDIDKILVRGTEPISEKIANCLIENGTVHPILSGEGLKTLEDILNNKPNGDLSDMYTFSSEYIRQLPKSGKEQLARSFSRGNQELIKTLTNLWGKGIMTEGGIRNRDDSIEGIKCICLNIPNENGLYADSVKCIKNATKYLEDPEIQIVLDDGGEKIKMVNIFSKNLYQVLSNDEVYEKMEKYSPEWEKAVKKAKDEFEKIIEANVENVKEYKEKSQMFFEYLQEFREKNNAKDNVNSNILAEDEKLEEGNLIAVDISDVDEIERIDTKKRENGFYIEDVVIIENDDILATEEENRIIDRTKSKNEKEKFLLVFSKEDKCKRVLELCEDKIKSMIEEYNTIIQGELETYPGIEKKLLGNIEKLKDPDSKEH